MNNDSTNSSLNSSLNDLFNTGVTDQSTESIGDSGTRGKNKKIDLRKGKRSIETLITELKTNLLSNTRVDSLGSHNNVEAINSEKTKVLLEEIKSNLNSLLNPNLDSSEGGKIGHNIKETIDPQKIETLIEEFKTNLNRLFTVNIDSSKSAKQTDIPQEAITSEKVTALIEEFKKSLDSLVREALINRLEQFDNSNESRFEPKIPQTEYDTDFSEEFDEFFRPTNGQVLESETNDALINSGSIRTSTSTKSGVTSTESSNSHNQSLFRAMATKILNKVYGTVGYREKIKVAQDPDPEPNGNTASTNLGSIRTSTSTKSGVTSTESSNSHNQSLFRAMATKILNKVYGTVGYRKKSTVTPDPDPEPNGTRSKPK